MKIARQQPQGDESRSAANLSGRICHAGTIHLAARRDPNLPAWWWRTSSDCAMTCSSRAQAP